MTAHKLFRVRKDGSLGSLFINRRARLPFNKWIEAKAYPTKGFKFRPFWHCMSEPVAPHLSMTGREWFEVEIESYEIMERPASQGGLWYLASGIKILT